MMRLLALVVLLHALIASAAAQQRYATVRLEGGRELQGRVLEMNLEELKLVVGEEVLSLPANKIRTCRFQDEPPAAAPAGEVAPAAPAGEAPAEAVDPAEAAEAVDPAEEGAGEAPKPHVTWTAPRPDPVDPSALDVLPVDERDLSRLQRRIGKLDEFYPWLAPAAPAQWLSLGLFLLVGAGLFVHFSVYVAGADRPHVLRSAGLGVGYCIAGVGQLALAPVTDLSITMMLTLNVSFALFLLCKLYSLTRLQALTAMVVQLGSCAAFYGLLELVTRLLDTVQAAG